MADDTTMKNNNKTPKFKVSESKKKGKRTTTATCGFILNSDDSNNIMNEEFDLNMKHQIGEIKEPFHVGYEYNKGCIIFAIILPEGLLDGVIKQ